MSETTIRKSYGSPKMVLKFEALDRNGSPLPAPQGEVVWTVPDETVLLHAETDPNANTQAFTLVGIAGTCDVTGTDGVQVSICHVTCEGPPVAVEVGSRITEVTPASPVYPGSPIPSAYPGSLVTR